MVLGELEVDVRVFQDAELKLQFGAVDEGRQVRQRALDEPTTCGGVEEERLPAGEFARLTNGGGGLPGRGECGFGLRELRLQGGQGGFDGPSAGGESGFAGGDGRAFFGEERIQNAGLQAGISGARRKRAGFDRAGGAGQEGGESRSDGALVGDAVAFVAAGVEPGGSVGGLVEDLD